MSNGLRHVFSPTRFNAAEAILGVTALVLVIWLLWPEAVQPKLDQQLARDEHLRQAEQERTEKPVIPSLAVEDDPGADRRAPASAAPSVPPVDLASADLSIKALPAGKGEPVGDAERLLEQAALIDREAGDRRIKKTWVFGDRTFEEPAATPMARGDDFQPPEPGPSDVLAATVLEQRPALANAVPRNPASGDQAQPSPTVADQPTAARDAEPASVSIASIDVAVYSSEALDAAHNPPAGSLESDDFAIESNGAADVHRRPRDDAPSWLRNAVAASQTDSRPVIAVVMDDLGLNRPGTRALNALPGPLTLAFLPYAGNIEAQTEAAHEAGHELMVHMPMEPFGPDWPGPDALTTKIDRGEFVTRLRKNLDRIKGYVGVNNHMGSRLTSDRGRMDLVMRELRKRDVLFLDSKTSPRSVASDMASRNGVPNTIRDVFLDHVIDIEVIRRQMAQVERIARRTGSAVAIGHPHSATIQALREWLPKLEQRGFAIAPISAVVARRACREGLLITPQTCGQYLQAQKPGSPIIASGGG